MQHLILIHSVLVTAFSACIHVDIVPWARLEAQPVQDAAKATDLWGGMLTRRCTRSLRPSPLIFFQGGLECLAERVFEVEGKPHMHIPDDPVFSDKDGLGDASDVVQVKNLF